MIFSEDLDDDHFTIAIDTYNDPYGSGDYKQLPFSMVEKPVCKSVIANWKYFDASVKYGVNTDCPLHNRTCPIPKGTYYVKDVVIKPNNWPLIMPRGFFKAIVTLKKDNQVVGTQEIGIKIVDRTT
ncbi:hypothetical protein KR032_004573 [Drosophila birchii]|nr:hypothetical protein KR032_004573 [Drosophila birchii]